MTASRLFGCWSLPNPPPVPGCWASLGSIQVGIHDYAVNQTRGRLGQPEESAELAVSLATGYGSFIDGAVIPVRGRIEANLLQQL